MYVSVSIQVIRVYTVDNRAKDLANKALLKSTIHLIWAYKGFTIH